MPKVVRGKRVSSAKKAAATPKTAASKKKAANAVSEKISMLRKEGKSPKQAVAMALSMKGKKKPAKKK